MPESLRDFQRQRVYDAGWQLSNLPLAGATVAEVQQFVDHLCDLAWFRRRWGRQLITVHERRGAGGYTYTGMSAIYVGLNKTGKHGRAPGATVRNVLHEVAHVVADSNDPGHGPSFARTYLELVEHAMGAEAGAVLRTAYKEHRVRMASPTPLRSSQRTPPPRPLLHTYRFQLDEEPPIVLQATSLLNALDQLTSVTNVYRRRLRTDKVTKISLWLSRAPSLKKVATRSPRQER